MKASGIDRRTFLKGAGVLFASALAERQAVALSRSDMVFAATCRRPDGRYGAVLLNDAFEVIREIPLPDRGHDVTFNRQTGDAVIFARRPGNFAIVFDCKKLLEPRTVLAPEGRHFYGHGVYSPDGKLLYATENDFEAAEGKIGIYDATDGYRRIGEISSFGIGPHDVVLTPDGRHLVIANGGIETHPDFGRAKLNIPLMEPSIVFVDRDTGTLIERHQPPQNLHKLSLRHLAITFEGQVIFGAQYEGPAHDHPPLTGRLALGDEIRFWDCLSDTACQRRNYIGSVAISRDGVAAALSAPRDNAFALISIVDGTVLRSDRILGVCGVAADRMGFVASSDTGYLDSLHNGSHVARHGIAFDNHLSVTTL